jgi:hypothetical protein
VQSSGEPGRIRFTAHSQGLKEASVEVTIK